jgi:hypothetical protein
MRFATRPHIVQTTLAAIAAGIFVVSCTPAEKEKTADFGESLGLAACSTESVEKEADSRCFTFRSVAGVSMGGGTAARLAFTYPELFDVAGIMGTPFADNYFLWAMIERNQLAGFCPLEELEALVAEDPDAINDPNNPRAFCGVHDITPENEDYENIDYQQVSPNLFPAVEGSECAMFRSDFNHWYRGTDAGRGGGFTRSKLIRIFHDIVAAQGNPLSYNPDDPYFPIGIPESWHKPPQAEGFDTQALCDNPILVPNIYNREFNPEGTYNLVTFCDGDSDGGGDYVPGTPGSQSEIVEFALAVDINGNGMRDYGEPVVVNNRERYLDVGADGIADVDEPGYDPATNPDPAGDNWDPMLNPRGTEENWRHDEGEPYDDDGLDGVPATMDYGEGNGVYDISPTLEGILNASPADLFDALPQSQVERLDIWMDAGIRDFLNTAQISNALFGRIKERLADSVVYNDFDTLPGIPEGQGYEYGFAEYSREAMGQAAYLRYGDASLCPDSDPIFGDGNHVGPDIIHRLYTLISFMGARQPAQGRDRSFGGDLADLESPTGKLTDFGFLTSYESEVLGREQRYGILLPPDYFLEEAVAEDRRYPVMYFFHGQGQSAPDMVAIGLLLWGGMQESTYQHRIDSGVTDFQRSIIVWADGECLGDECWTGNFYADFEGRPRDDRRFEQAMIELMREIEDKYRVKKPEMIPLKDL